MQQCMKKLGTTLLWMPNIWKKSKACKHSLLYCIVSQCSRGKQIAIARLSAKLYARDKETFALQEVRYKHRQMMKETPVFKQTSEPGTPPVVPPMGIPPAGAHPTVTDRFKKPPNSSDPDIPASDSGPSEGRRRWGGPPAGPDPDPHEPPGRAPDRNTDSKKSKACSITPPALLSPPGFHLWRSSVRDAYLNCRSGKVNCYV